MIISIFVFSFFLKELPFIQNIIVSVQCETIYYKTLHSNVTLQALTLIWIHNTNVFFLYSSNDLYIYFFLFLFFPSLSANQTGRASGWEFSEENDPDLWEKIIQESGTED